MKWRGRWYFIKPWKNFFFNLFSTWEKWVSLNCGNFCRTTHVSTILKLFNFHELSGLDCFRKWTVTGNGIADLEISINVHPKGRWGHKFVTVRKCWGNATLQLPKYRNPNRFFGHSEICLLLKSSLFSIITTHGSDRFYKEICEYNLEIMDHTKKYVTTIWEIWRIFTSG